MRLDFYQLAAATAAHQSQATPQDVAQRTRESAGLLSASLRDARLFRALLAEMVAALPPGVVSADLIERTRAALAGETNAKPMTLAEAVDAAVERLSALPGITRTEPT